MRNVFLKIVSVLLVLTGLFSTLYHLGSTAVSAASAADLSAWDFEHNDISRLGTADGADADGYNAVGDLQIVSGGANGTNYALKISGSEVGNGLWIYGLESNTEYEVTFYAKIENWGGTAYPNFGVNGYNGNDYVAHTEYTNQWGLYILRFRTGANSTAARIYTWTFGSGNVDFYIDEVSIKKAALMSAWNFESNNLTNLGTANGADADGYNAEGNLSIVPGGANGTDYALKISGAESGNGQWLWGLKSNTEYVVTFYAKMGNWGGASYPNFGVNEYDGGAYVSADVFTGQWQPYYLTFRTGANSTSARIYTWIFGSGQVDFFVDEVVVMPVHEAYTMEISGIPDRLAQGGATQLSLTAQRNGQTVTLTDISWQMSGMTKKETKIENGKLTVSASEPAGTVLQITAKAKVDGRTLTATKTVKVSVRAGVEKWNLSLSDSIGIQFYTKIDSADVSNTEAVIAYADQSETLCVGDAVFTGEYYVFSVQLAAAQMTQEVLFELQTGGNTVFSQTYSVIQYAMYILQDINGEFDETTKAIVREMLAYGDAAQKYFDYNREKTIDANLLCNTVLAQLPQENRPMQPSGEVNGIYFWGASLILETRIAIRYYFRSTKSIDGYTFAIGDTWYTPVSKDDLWYIEVADILPQQIDQAIELTVTDGTDTMTVSYGPMDYMIRKNTAGAEKIRDLVNALYNYHIAAKNYLLQYDIAYTGSLSGNNLVLLYNTLGYEATGTKRAFVRAVDYIEPGKVGANSGWILQDMAGNAVMKGRLEYEGLSYGMQLWGLNFSDHTGQGQYTLKVELTDTTGASVYTAVSQPFRVENNLYSQNVLLPLTLYNAQARIAPDSLGGGYYDCNTTMGEAYSHGIFLNGLVQTYQYQKDSLDNQTALELENAAARAFDYLLLLHNDQTGEFIHSYPGRYNEDINLGIHNSVEALYGFAAYLNYFSEIDPARASKQNYERAVQTVDYLEANIYVWTLDSLGYPYKEYLIPVYYHLYQYSGDQKWLDRGIALVDKLLSDVNVRTMYRSGARGISVFEGVYLFAQQLEGTETYNKWITQLITIKDTYYADLARKNAFAILPVSNKVNASTEWDNMWKMPAGEYDYNWYLTTGRACNAMDACFLGILTQDDSLEEIAAGEIGFVFGLNPGFSGDLVMNPTTGDAYAAGALVDNLDAQRVRGWHYWGFEMAEDAWLSIMNGFRIENGEYVFRDDTTDDWYYGETFIKHDGAYAYAMCLYEYFINQ